MAEFLTTTGTIDRLERLVADARERFVLVSPYLQPPRIPLERLAEADARGVALTLVSRENQLKADERRKLDECLPRLERYYLDNLHAKCYASEAGVLVTSLNLYEHSVRTNREVGVLLAPGEPAFDAAWTEVYSILAAARREDGLLRAAPDRPTAGRPPLKPVPAVLGGAAGGASDRARGDARGRRLGSALGGLFGRARHAAAGRTAGPGAPAAPPRPRGHCVRCRRGVFLDPARPLCADCFRVWAEYGNTDYEERWCHDCGAEAATSMARPLCRPCWTQADSF